VNKDYKYWKRRALNQQSAIDTVERHNDRLRNQNAALQSALNSTREKLKKLEALKEVEE
jgi:predicted nuclease with TOPRIM domain